MLYLFFCISFSLDNESRLVNFSSVLQSFLTQLCFSVLCLYRVLWCLIQSPVGILFFKKTLNPKAPQKASPNCFPCCFKKKSNKTNKQRKNKQKWGKYFCWFGFINVWNKQILLYSSKMTTWNLSLNFFVMAGFSCCSCCQECLLVWLALGLHFWEESQWLAIV